MAMSDPLRSALAQLRRAAVDARAQTTALELLHLAAAATSGTPVDLHRDVQLATEEAIRMLRVSGNAAPMRAAASGAGGGPNGGGAPHDARESASEVAEITEIGASR